jgi:hypothetical protein
MNCISKTWLARGCCVIALAISSMRVVSARSMTAGANNRVLLIILSLQLKRITNLVSQVLRPPWVKFFPAHAFDRFHTN